MSLENFYEFGIYVFLNLCRDAVMMLSALNDHVGAKERKKLKLKRREYNNQVRMFLI